MQVSKKLMQFFGSRTSSCAQTWCEGIIFDTKHDGQKQFGKIKECWKISEYDLSPTFNVDQNEILN